MLIIQTLGLEDVAPADIPATLPLFGGGLGLDSVDALELGLALQTRYGISIDTDAEDVQSHFATVASLAAFVDSRR
jgi:acyl carrier protein